MKNYTINTYVTMKEYNAVKWWIDGKIIPPLHIQAETLKEAIEKYQDIVVNNYYITITKTALKNKKPVYIDTINGPLQTGFCITGSTDFEKPNYTGWSKQYIDLWLDIMETKHPDFNNEKIA